MAGLLALHSFPLPTWPRTLVIKRDKLPCCTERSFASQVFLALQQVVKRATGVERKICWGWCWRRSLTISRKHFVSFLFSTCPGRREWTAHDRDAWWSSIHTALGDLLLSTALAGASGQEEEQRKKASHLLNCLAQMEPRSAKMNFRVMLFRPRKKNLHVVYYSSFLFHVQANNPELFFFGGPQV